MIKNFIVGRSLWVVRYFSKQIHDDLASLVFFTISTVALLCHITLMNVIPLPWLDEVHIVEMGRIALGRGSLETTFMMNSDGHSSYSVFYYLGPILQELSYRIFGIAGVRFSPLLGLLIATIFCRAWLIKKGVSLWVATLLSLMVLCDPLLIQSVRLVRVDSWTIALFFMTVYLVRCAFDRQGSARAFRFFITGVLAGMSVFVWPTALIFVFFYLAELWDIHKKTRLSISDASKILLIVGSGACAISILLMAPLLSQIFALAANTRLYFSWLGVGKSIDLAVLTYGICICVLKECLRAPFFMLAVFIGFFGIVFHIRRQAVLLGCFLSAFFVCVISGLHTFRFIYLFPFFFLFAITGIQRLADQYPKGSKGLLACILLYGLTTSYLICLGMSFVYKGRSISAVTKHLRDTIGSGEKKVYSRTLQTYYPARTLGWKHYRYADDRLILDDDKNANLLAKVDYVIDSVKAPYYAIEESFTFYGMFRDFLIRAAIDTPQDDGTATSTPNGRPRMQTFFSHMGKSLASGAVPPNEQLPFEQKLGICGFQKVLVIDLTTPSSAYTPLQRWLLSKQATNPDYDKLVIWKRTATKPD